MWFKKKKKKSAAYKSVCFHQAQSVCLSDGFVNRITHKTTQQSQNRPYLLLVTEDSSLTLQDFWQFHSFLREWCVNVNKQEKNENLKRRIKVAGILLTVTLF